MIDSAMATSARPRPAGVSWIAIAICGIATIGIGFFFGYLARSLGGVAETLPALEQVSISRCVERRILTLKPEKLVAEILDDAADACHKLLYNELWLNDFTLRRAKFLEQSRDGHVLLWVVVSITISGVALAALQLAASYQLALSGRQDLDQPSELILEKSRISLKSSVTGLFILLISFAFFALFVNEIYRIKELRIGPSTNEVAQKNDEPQQIDAQPIEQITVPRSR